MSILVLIKLKLCFLYSVLIPLFHINNWFTCCCNKQGTFTLTNTFVVKEFQQSIVEQVTTPTKFFNSLKIDASCFFCVYISIEHGLKNCQKWNSIKSPIQNSLTRLIIGKEVAFLSPEKKNINQKTLGNRLHVTNFFYQVFGRKVELGDIGELPL